ncbi:MAG: TrkH family potassium uptake protein [Phycisphaeraceae bacterium]|nr:TrkH family potassium uptake protein [Phycisphaeraceae bacterium]
MNYRFVARQLGLLLVVMSVALAATMIYELILVWGGEADAGEAMAARALGISTSLGAILGGTIWFFTRKHDQDWALARREAMLLVATSWVIGAALAALPFLLWAHLGSSHADHPFRTFTACYFEAMSGLSTTGATVLGGEHSKIADLPKGLLLWRSLTHWLGGLGIVVLFVAVLPMVGTAGKKMFSVESTADKGGVRPRITETARVLWLIYLGLTVLCIMLLKATGKMGWFDSVNHAFSVMGTGGLSTNDASIGGFDSVAVDLILTAFMILAGVNFVVYFHLVQRRWRSVLDDVELRIYLALKILVTVVIALNLLNVGYKTTAGADVEGGFFTMLRYASFQTASLQTGTGFCTADYDAWPMMSVTLLMGLMLIGGCGGSTAGGFKVFRFWVLLKVLFAALERAFRPNVVRPIKVGKTTIEDDTKLSCLVYFAMMILLTALGTTLTLLFEEPNGIDVQTAASASYASLCNVGPGLHGVGATRNYGWMQPATLWVQSALMCLGRLEVYALLVLLVPRFWRGD